MRKIILSAFLLLATIQLASAATWFVRPDDGRTTKTGVSAAFAFDKITSATAVAVTNDTIQVAGGTYLERARIIVPNTKDNLTIKGSYNTAFTTTGTATQTIIDGQRARGGMTFTRVGFTLSDIKFVNCNANNLSVNGVANGAVGGGVNADLSIAAAKVVTLRRCQFENCTAVGSGNNSGAAMEFGFTTAVTSTNHRANLLNCVVTSCTATASANPPANGYTAIDFNRGQSIPNVFVNGLIIRDCIAANNSLAFRCSNSSMVTSMTNVLIFNVRNTRTGVVDGGIAHMRGRLGSYFNNMTVDHCSAPNYFFDLDTGGNVVGTNYLTVSNNIFSNNTATTKSQAVYVPSLFLSGTNLTSYTQRYGTFKNNLFYNNFGTTQTLKIMANTGGSPTEWDSQILADATNKQGSTSAFDPRFNGPYPSGSNYHLTENGANISAAKNAGTASMAVQNSRLVDPQEVISFPTGDLDGFARPRGAGWDLGAYEFDFSTPVEMSRFSVE